MKNFCEKHHLGYNGDRCPMCEKERIASFKVSKSKITIVLPGQAPRESYYEEYRPPINDDIVVLDYDEQIVPNRNKKTMSVDTMAELLASKFGNVSIVTKTK